MICQIFIRFKGEVTAVSYFLKGSGNSAEIYLHRKRYVVRIILFVIIVNMERLQMMSQRFYHLRSRRVFSHHLRVSDIQTSNEICVIYSIKMGKKAFGRRARGVIRTVFCIRPIPHILGCYLHSVLFCERQKLKVHFCIFFGCTVVIGMDNANASTCLCSAFYGSFASVSYLFAVNGKRRVRLITMDTVILTDTFKLSRKSQIFITA